MKYAVIVSTLLLAGLAVFGAHTLTLAHQTTAAHVGASQAAPPPGDISQSRALAIGRDHWVAENGSASLADGAVTGITADYLLSAQVGPKYGVVIYGDSQPYVWLITYHNYHEGWYESGVPGLRAPRSGFTANGYLILDPANGKVLVDFSE